MEPNMCPCQLCWCGKVTSAASTTIGGWDAIWEKFGAEAIEALENQGDIRETQNSPDSDYSRTEARKSDNPWTSTHPVQMASSSDSIAEQRPILEPVFDPQTAQMTSKDLSSTTSSQDFTQHSSTADNVDYEGNSGTLTSKVEVGTPEADLRHELQGSPITAASPDNGSGSPSGKRSLKRPRSEEPEVGEETFDCSIADSEWNSDDDHTEHDQQPIESRSSPSSDHHSSTSKKRKVLQEHVGSEVSEGSAAVDVNLTATNNDDRRKHKCVICNSRFVTAKDRKVHVKEHMDESGVYKCSHCGKFFPNYCHIERHVLLHIGERRYQCDKCPKAFVDKKGLQQHLLAHTTEKLFKCDNCFKSFTLKCNLKQHVRVHTGEKPYTCKICAKSFTLSGSLKEHLKRHSREKSYKCDHCDQSFTLQAQLTAHVRIHGEKPYKCDNCSKCFTHKCYLKQHVLVHTGEKPFKCGHCVKSFKNRSALFHHTRAHVEGKPLVCEICSKAFRLKTSLICHQRNHCYSKSVQTNQSLK